MMRAVDSEKPRRWTRRFEAWLALAACVIGAALLIPVVLALLFSAFFGEDRVARARADKEPALRTAVAAMGLSYPPKAIYLRAIKDERLLEVWISEDGSKFSLFRSYPIVAMSGTLGPKRREGDRQVPEGFYQIDRFNPRSAYHLSLGINYPNQRDRAMGEAKPGGDIFIHGSNVSIGCLAMTDDKIEEVYLLALDAKKKPVRVDIYPTRLQGQKYRALLGAQDQHVRQLWESMRPRWERFETDHSLANYRTQGTLYFVDN
jgi:murein L,D-transpeptidase YafK